MPAAAGKARNGDDLGEYDGNPILMSISHGYYTFPSDTNQAREKNRKKLSGERRPSNCRQLTLCPAIFSGQRARISLRRKSASIGRLSKAMNVALSCITASFILDANSSLSCTFLSGSRRIVFLSNKAHNFFLGNRSHPLPAFLARNPDSSVGRFITLTPSGLCEQSRPRACPFCSADSGSWLTSVFGVFLASYPPFSGDSKNGVSAERIPQPPSTKTSAAAGEPLFSFDDGRKAAETPTTSLRGIGHFMAQKGKEKKAEKTRNQTCNKNPRICRAKGSPGPDCCKKKCVNVMSDRQNCGVCGKKCRYDETCCRGKCVSVLFDKNNCGGCRKKCKKGTTCVYGMCSYA
nr:stigma-specific STIG1-like protein 1 [Ipomoea batatas]